MHKSARHLLLAACAVLALAVSGCAAPEKPRMLPITPPARDKVSPCVDDARGGSGQYEPVRYEEDRGREGRTAWSAAERAAANFIHAAPVFFHFDSAVLTDNAQAVLRQKAEKIKAFPQLRVTIAGHCDERGSDAYNYALGHRRANAARDYLVRLGVPAGQLDTVSYGRSRPKVPGQNEEAWSLNRRDEFEVNRR